MRVPIEVCPIVGEGGSIDLAIISQCTYSPLTTCLTQSNDVSGSISGYIRLDRALITAHYVKFITALLRLC